MVITTVVRQLEDKKPIELGELEMSGVCDTEEAWNEEVTQAIQDLLWSGDLESINGSSFMLSHDAFLPLKALYYDSKLRYGLYGMGMIDFLMKITNQSVE